MSVDLRTFRPRAQAALAQIPFHQWVQPDGNPWTLFYRVGGAYLLRFPGLADFEVSRDGRVVSAWPAVGVSEATMQHLHLNQVLPLALSRQACVVLHASAVEFDGIGVAFIGDSGRGKSTMATSFATAGSRFLTDDGLQLAWAGGEAQIKPSHPSVRLWEDSQAALIQHDVEMAPSLEYTSKARVIAGGGLAFCQVPQPLRRVYFLGDGTAAEPTIEAVPPAEALIGLVRNSFLLDIDERDVLAWQFDELTRLAEMPIHYRLDYPRRYDELPHVRAEIIRHASE